MELKLKKEKINSLKVIFNAVQEQAAELDYVLPDYYPEIHKIIKCIAEPHVTSRSISDSILSYDITVFIKILYCSENSNAINIIEQKLVYCKNADLQQKTISPDIKINVKTDYINCRAINSRRIDLRGAISADITVKDIVEHQLISDADGMGVQLYRVPVTYPTNRIFTEKQVIVTDEIELGASKSPIGSIIYADAAVITSDKKIIANKIVVKGELNVNMLYTFNDNSLCGAETMQFSIPFSQIIDMEGIDDNYECRVDIDVICCEIHPVSSGNGTSDTAECRTELLIKCSGFCISTVELATDHYSTGYESDSVNINVSIGSVPEYINKTITLKSSIEDDMFIPEQIYGVRCTVSNCMCFVDSSEHITLNGTAEYTIFGCTNENTPFVNNKTESFTTEIPFETTNENCTIDISVKPVLSTYNIVSENKIDISSELNICGTVQCNDTINGITEIEIKDELSSSDMQDCALKLYFAQSGESIWDIAKHYKASLNAITEENDLTENLINENCMLIIPMA